MKDLKSILKESIFDDDIDVYSGIKDEIKRFIEDNYIYSDEFIISNKPNKSGKYEVSTTGSIAVNNKNISSLTNNLFEWTKVKGLFDCNDCESLKTLEGAPKIVGGYFDCSGCNKLKSLEGAPERVGGFYGTYCKSLKTLKGAPKYVAGLFDCRWCGTKFTKDDIIKVSNVKGNIYC